MLCKGVTWFSLHSLFPVLILAKLTYPLLPFLLIEIWQIYNIMLVSGIQHSDSVFLQIIFYYRLLQDNGCNSLCYTVYLCFLSFIYIQQFVSVNPIPLICPFPSNHKFVFFVYKSVSVLRIHSIVIFFGFYIYVISYSIFHCLTYFTKDNILQVHSCC